MIRLCFDSLGEYKIGYPNLAQSNLAPDQFDSTWPFTIPFRIQMYLKAADVPVSYYTIENAPAGSWYPISLGWHNFECDYFALLSPIAKQRLRDKQITLLFHYHEGDNPLRIKQRFDQLCAKHSLPLDCYVFLSANSAASKLSNFFYFPDHENFFKFVNRHQSAAAVTQQPRTYVFTSLSRAHKWWRATCMSQLSDQHLLENSYWSYNTKCLVGDRIEDNPIPMTDDEVVLMNNFISNGPYYCDSDNADAHNDHRSVAEHLYTHSYCNIVLETLFDADQSGGAFVTEKTYKCIKFGQPFVIVGAAGSLRALRADGYRTFDHVIDNRYDDIEDNSERWAAIKNLLLEIKQQDLYQLYTQCLPDLKHNQRVFMQQQTPALQRLIDFLTAHRNAV